MQETEQPMKCTPTCQTCAQRGGTGGPCLGAGSRPFFMRSSECCHQATCASAEPDTCAEMFRNSAAWRVVHLHGSCAPMTALQVQRMPPGLLIKSLRPGQTPSTLLRMQSIRAWDAEQSMKVLECSVFVAGHEE